MVPLGLQLHYINDDEEESRPGEESRGEKYSTMMKAPLHADPKHYTALEYGGQKNSRHKRY